MPKKVDISKQIRLRRSKIKSLQSDLAKAQAKYEQLRVSLHKAVDSQSGKAKKSALVGNLRKKVSEREAEIKAISEVIEVHESKLEALLTEQAKEGLRTRVRALLDASEIALKDYRRCENLKHDFCQLLFEIASERDHVIKRFIELVEAEGTVALKKAGLDFEALQNEWRTASLTLFDFEVNQRIQSTTVQRYSLLNELQAVVNGKGKFHRYAAPPVLVQPEPPAGKSMTAEESRKFRAAMAEKMRGYKTQMPTMVVNGAPERNM